jgi:hypothetical protein
MQRILVLGGSGGLVWAAAERKRKSEQITPMAVLVLLVVEVEILRRKKSLLRMTANHFRFSNDLTKAFSHEGGEAGDFFADD